MQLQPHMQTDLQQLFTPVTEVVSTDHPVVLRLKMVSLSFVCLIAASEATTQDNAALRGETPVLG